MSREVQKQSMVCTWLSSDSLFCQNTPCCSCSQVRGICVWSSFSKYPVWMQEGLASSQRARYFTTLLSTLDSWFLPDSSAKHWTQLTIHYRKPATSLSSFLSLACQVLISLAHSLQNAALSPFLFPFSKLLPWVILGGWRRKSLLVSVHLLSLPTTSLSNFLLYTSDTFFSGPAHTYFLSQ